MEPVKLRLVAVTAALVMVSTALVGTAAAGHVTCGNTITQDTTLDSDVGPCLGDTDGIIIGADGVTLDLNGYDVIGDPNLDGEFAEGIVIQGRETVTVTSSEDGGTVRDFDAGVTITQGSSNVTVKDIAVRDNIGNPSLGSDFGDGIAIFNSSDNLIKGNVVDHNGPFDGIGVVQFGSGTSATGNEIVGNEVINNNIPSSATINQDDGIRLEPGTADNTVTDNTVHANGLDGIAAFADSTGNTLRDNDVRGNGFHDKAHRKGDGIRVFDGADNTTIDQGNEAFDNAANGIRVDSRGNEILDNLSGDNADAATLEQDIGPLTVTVDHRVRLQAGGEELEDPAPAYDLHDSNTDDADNPTCDDNTWSGNTWDTAFPECTTG